jgi:hypothetical protein
MAPTFARAVSGEHERVLSSSSQLLLYRLEAAVNDLPFEPFRPLLEMELSIALRRDLPACDCRLRLRVDERLDSLQRRSFGGIVCDDLNLLIL